jgi:hypothetical protein
MPIMQQIKKERRLYPRVQASFPIQLTLEANGDLHTFDSHTINISVNSMQIEGNGEMIMCFQAQETLPRTGMLNFTPPGVDTTVSVPCQLFNYRRLSQHSYTVVLSYAAMNEESRARIQQFVARNTDAE